MLKYIESFRHSLAYKLIFAVGLTLFFSISFLSFFIIKYEKKKALNVKAAEVCRLSETIQQGAHYAMMLNSRDDLNQIVHNIGKQSEIEYVRIFNNAGEVRFSNIRDEIGDKTDIKAEACNVCHLTEPPLQSDAPEQKNRIFTSPNGYRLMGITSHIYNETGCSGDCHFHPQDEKVLGTIDVVVSLQNTDKQILFYEKGLIVFAILIFLVIATIIGLFVMRFVNQPIKQLIQEVHNIRKGDCNGKVLVDRNDEMGQLVFAIRQMSEEIGHKQEALDSQRKEYRMLFGMVPCLITVQDKNFKLLRYNHEFAECFDPHEGDYCFAAYKNRTEPCEACPVLKTFEDGKSHHSEQSGVNRDGTPSYWTLKTAPIHNRDGDIIAVMEISMDITKRRMLEQEVFKSETKYRAIFNHIPNPLFVLDKATLEILDCNDSVNTVYGFEKEGILHHTYGRCFDPDYRDYWIEEIKTCKALNKVRQIDSQGNVIYADIRVSPSEYLGKEVLLLTATDITYRLKAEQQLIQASKMTTLGEMATGVAHELNQPLSVIKTASNFLLKKVKHQETIADNIMLTMTEEIDGQVDRAAKIINHMREFGHKSEVTSKPVQVNIPLEKAFELFSRQLELREIKVIKTLEKELPMIMADSNRLEQIFINLLINARDAIEECIATDSAGSHRNKKTIWLRTYSDNNGVCIEVEDSGSGIPAQVSDKIFEPFFTTKKVGKGTGLGLSISYGIVHDYDGAIRVTNGEQGGARFIIRFPLAQNDSD